MMKRLFTVIVLLPVAIILIALSVANRTRVPFSLDPFSADNPALTVSVPLFLLLFLALIAGLVIGGMAVWFGQHRYRKAAKERKTEADELRYRAAMAERDNGKPATLHGGLPAIGRN